MKRLETFQKAIADFVKTVVQKAEKDIEKEFGPDICSMQEQIRKYDMLLSKLTCLSTDLSCQHDDTSECKKILECMRAFKEIQIEPCVFDDKLTIEQFQNEIIEAVNGCLRDDKLFRTVELVHLEKSLTIPNLCVKEDVTSSSLLIADYSEGKIRRVDRELIETECFDVKGNIWGICEIRKQEIAFTTTRLMKVQFLSTDKSEISRKSFDTNLHCRGIAYHNEKIYVTGGGVVGEETGQLNIFNLEGKLLCKHYRDSEGTYFSIPRSITVNTEGIYVTDQQNGIICLDLEGKRKWVCNNSTCKFPWGICFTPNGNLFVSGRGSNNIVIVKKDGEFLGELLNGNDGLSKPKAIGMDKRNNRIIISEAKKPCLKVFFISDCEL